MKPIPPTSAEVVIDEKAAAYAWGLIKGKADTLQLMATTGGTPPPLSPTPEPATLALLFDEATTPCPILAELYLVGAQIKLDRTTLQPHPRFWMQHRDNLSRRVQELLTLRPDLLHPHVLVAPSPSEKRGIPVLDYLVLCGAALSPEWLCKLAGDGVGGPFVREALDAGGDALLSNALNARMGCARTATAITLARSDLAHLDPIDNKLFDDLVELCARAAIGDQRQVDEAARLLDALRDRQTAAGGDEARVPWPIADDAFEVTDMAWASARSIHPVTQFVYSLAVSSAASWPVHNGDAEGWPSRPLERLVDGLNALLIPASRLSLDQIGGDGLLRLIALCPSSRESASCWDFWHNPSGWKRINNPLGLIAWAIKRPRRDGGRVLDSALAGHEDQFQAAIGAAGLQRLQSMLTANSMIATISEAIPAAVKSTKRRRATL